jgi:hypothetical protein
MRSARIHLMHIIRAYVGCFNVFLALHQPGDDWCFNDRIEIKGSIMFVLWALWHWFYFIQDLCYLLASEIVQINVKIKSILIHPWLTRLSIHTTKYVRTFCISQSIFVGGNQTWRYQWPPVRCGWYSTMVHVHSAWTTGKISDGDDLFCIIL